MTEHIVKFVTPKAPNFIAVDTGDIARREDGFRSRLMIRVADLTDDQKDQLAREWRKALDDVADRQRLTGGDA